MRVPILTALTDARSEAALVAALESADHGVTLVRRCVDLADLVAAASAGTARAALVASDLRRLDREALARLDVAGVAVVVLLPPDDEDAERRMRQLGVTHLLAYDAPPAVIAALAVEAAAGHATARPRPGSPARPGAGLPDLADLSDLDLDVDALDAEPPLPQPGRVIAVWGPTGAPGRTTVATALASELAAAGDETLLVDADVYGAAVAQVLGLLDEAPGIASAARLANLGSLDVPALAGLARGVAPRLRVLTGIARAERWTELRPAAIEAVLALARKLTAFTVVDCAFCLEEDEELSFDTSTPRRNGATLAVLADADVILAVGSADPVSLQRLVRGLSRLADAVPGADPVVVVNRVRPSLLAGDPHREISAALERYAGVVPTGFVPYDLKAFDAALMAGRTLAEAAPSSPAGTAIRAVAAQLAGRAAPVTRRRFAVRR
ncbi:MAG TPA: P-loop NTPase [Mycobacteriales bacterium]|jgi:MinD-like ATPase involved in chromosome partitioning or flagellar assembly|nr:P-loop NTPase [Mycobacteriales bacterium]